MVVSASFGHCLILSLVLIVASAVLLSQPWDRSMGSVGRPVPGAQVAIVANQDGDTPVPLTQEGQEGEMRRC